MKTLFKIVVVAAAAGGLQGTQGQLVTCPGFPGYCSEAYPGDTCTVVCAFGRNNVPLCQPDGTWTDVPRCIEHEPGKPTQKTGWCPGVPGYCSDSPPGSLCEFDCLFGKDISSYCTTEGTWDPYPTCEGDIRETRDGCDGCPGPFGGPRDRTKEGGAYSGGGGQKKSPARKQGNNRNNPRAIGGNRSSSNNKNNVASTRNKNRNVGNRKNNNRNKNGGNRNNNRKNNRNNNNNRKNNNRNNNNRNGNNWNNNRKNNNGWNGNNRNNNRNGGNKNNNRRPGQSQSRSNNRSQISAAQPRSTNRKNGGGCTEEVLTKCMDVCPSEPINIFKACIKGCAKRC